MSQSSAWSGERGGRYIVFSPIASGGMATVYLGRLVGAAGFARTVAIKRLHPRLAADPQFVSSFVDEARLAACVRHPNVVPTLDVIVRDQEILVVMEYVEGESLSRLLKSGPTPLPIVAAIASQMLWGLHAAHEATSPKGQPLRLVHRDVSPQNVMVGTDGIARVLDFGIAKASWRTEHTRDGSLKGKIGYMAPEQLNWQPLDRRADLFAASVILWEALTGARLFGGGAAEEVVGKVLSGKVTAPSVVAPALPSALDAIVLRGLASNPGDRFATALEMAEALESVAPLATARELGAWVTKRSSESLAKRAELVRELERSTFEDSEVAAADHGARVPRADDDVATVSGRDPAPGVGEATHSGLSGVAPAPARADRRWLMIALLAGLVIAMAVPLAVGRSTRSPTHPPVAVASARPAAAAPLSSSIVGDAERPAPSSEPVQAAPSAPPVVASPPSLPRRMRPNLPAATPSRASKPVDCDPPYTVGPDGIRRFRPECI